MVAVAYGLTGAVTPSGFTASVKLDTPGTAVSLLVSTNSDLSAPVGTFGPVTADAHGYAKVSATGLAAGTQYHYGWVLGGVTQAFRGRARTFPAQGQPASFTFAASSCNLTGSTHKVFTGIQNRAPLFFAHLGDWGYPNIATNDQAAFRVNYDSNMGSAPQAALMAAVPLTYLFDDHDFGPNDSDRTTPAAPAAQAVYRQVVPSYPLPDSAGIYHSFWVGRVFFIATDVRSYRDPNTNPDSASKTALGPVQKAWFKEQMLAAKQAGAGLVVWLTPSVWKSGNGLGWDTWDDFPTERTELADFLRASNIRNVVIMCGDGHHLTFDDCSDYSTPGSGAPIPVFCNSALDNVYILQGRNWSSGNPPAVNCQGGEHYAYATITDTGSGPVTFDWRGVYVDNATGVETEVLRYAWTPQPAEGRLSVFDGTSHVRRWAKTWDGSAWVRRPVRVGR